MAAWTDCAQLSPSRAARRGGIIFFVSMGYEFNALDNQEFDDYPDPLTTKLIKPLPTIESPGPPAEPEA